MSHEMNPQKVWTVDQDHDVRVASWRVAALIYGEDDGSMERDAIECQIQEVIARSFDYTTVHDGPERRAECSTVARDIVAAIFGGGSES